jgi:AraC-like DNA-binding protein
MTETLIFLPAIALHAQLGGLAVLGLDMECIHRRVGPVPDTPDGLVTQQQYLNMWSEAHRLYNSSILPSALAMAIPFGAFGVLDYLVGSADSVAGCCESAALYYTMVASDVWLEIDVLEDGGRLIRVRSDVALPPYVFEFTIIAIYARLRFVTAGRFAAAQISLPIPIPQELVPRSALLQTRINYDFPFAEMLIDAKNWRLNSNKADPFLHNALTQITSQQTAVGSNGTSLEQALRPRLRAALSSGQADIDRMAALIGVSVRTLQRRLKDDGRGFADVVEDFRREEATRLLSDPNLHLIEITRRLGYSEQTSFTRAFRRWTNTTPGEWRESRRKAEQVS